MISLARSAETYVVSCSCGSHTRLFCDDGVAFAGQVACRSCGEAADWRKLVSETEAPSNGAEIIPLFA